jgi:hypothetical protein
MTKRRRHSDGRATAVTIAVVVASGIGSVLASDLGARSDAALLADGPQSHAPGHRARSEVKRSKFCSRRYAQPADVDGDGRKDLVYHVVIGYHAVLGVCTASGREDRTQGVGMAEVLNIIDVEPDGRDEIFYGGTTVSSAGGYVAVFVNGALHRVRLAGGPPLVWEDGLGPVFLVHNNRPAGAAYGCEDTNHDGRDELVDVIVQRDRGAFRWVKRAYAITGSLARRTMLASGRVKPRRGTFALVAAASRLTSPCKVKAPPQ